MLARTVRDLWHKALATTSLRCRKERYRWSIWTKAWKEYKLAPANVPAMPWPRAWNPCSSMRTILQRLTSWSIIHKMVAAMTSSLVQTTSPMTPASHPNRATHRPCVSPHGIALPCCSRAAPLASTTCRMSCRRSSICLFQWTTFSQVGICLFLFHGGGFFWFVTQFANHVTNMWVLMPARKGDFLRERSKDDERFMKDSLLMFLNRARLPFRRTGVLKLPKFPLRWQQSHFAEVRREGGHVRPHSP